MDDQLRRAGIARFTATPVYRLRKCPRCLNSYHVKERNGRWKVWFDSDTIKSLRPAAQPGAQRVFGD